MNLLRVDLKKCRRDGICVEVCPARIIELKDQNDVPAMVSGGNAFCMDCGHCVSVCPHGALSHARMPVEKCPSLQSELLPRSEQVEHLLRSRRSTRVYKKKGVQCEDLNRLIDIARYAPSGHNIQPVKWLIIYERQEVKRLAEVVVDWMRASITKGDPLAELLEMDHVVAAWEAGNDRISRDAPHVIFTYAKKEERTAPAGATIALTFLELAAFSMGLGACWAGYFNTAALCWPPMQEALALPQGNSTFGAMLVGYPKFKYQRLPLRKAANITWR